MIITLPTITFIIFCYWLLMSRFLLVYYLALLLFIIDFLHDFCPGYQKFVYFMFVCVNWILHSMWGRIKTIGLLKIIFIWWLIQQKPSSSFLFQLNNMRVLFLLFKINTAPYSYHNITITFIYWCNFSQKNLSRLYQHQDQHQVVYQ